MLLRHGHRWEVTPHSCLRIRHMAWQLVSRDRHGPRLVRRPFGSSIPRQLMGRARRVYRVLRRLRVRGPALFCVGRGSDAGHDRQSDHACNGDSHGVEPWGCKAARHARLTAALSYSPMSPATLHRIITRTSGNKLRSEGIRRREASEV
jgi:hypothetical protein